MKKRIMKLLFLSLIAILIFSSQAIANTNSKIGKKITAETPVYLDGVLVGDAVISEGTSFAPVRAISEALGVDVKYERSEEGSAINLSSPEKIHPKEIDFDEMMKESGLKAKITGANNNIERLTHRIENINKQLENETSETIIKLRKDDLIEAREQIIIEQENIIKYTNELLELESAK